MPDQLNPSLFAHISSEPSVLRIKLIGPTIGAREVPIITEMAATALEQFNAAKGSWLVIDMSQITFINSMGLGMCIDFRNRINKAGGKAALLGMNQQLLDLFKMVKVDRLFTIARDSAALNKLTHA